MLMYAENKKSVNIVKNIRILLHIVTAIKDIHQGTAELTLVVRCGYSQTDTAF